MPSPRDCERALLELFAANKDAWYQAFNPDVVGCCGGSIDLAEVTLRSLRRRKLIDAQGRGQFAQYGHKSGGE